MPLVSVVVLGALIHGSIGGSDDWWPFGPMSQYAMTVPDHDRLVTTYLMAETTDGRYVEVPLGAGGCGIGRAEIEGRVGPIVADPQRLQSIADGCARMHPRDPRYVRIDLVQDTAVLTDGVAGPATTDVLASWTVTP